LKVSSPHPLITEVYGLLEIIKKRRKHSEY
jgi:hypothetical protein